MQIKNVIINRTKKNRFIHTSKLVLSFYFERILNMKHIVKEKTNFMKKEFIYIIIGVFFVSCLNIVGIRTIINKSFTHKETKEFCYSEEFRKQCLDDAFINEIRKSHNVGEKVASYLYKKESVRMDYEEYQKYIKNIWDRVKFFPVAEFLSQTTYTISYSNSWMNERTYGGTRGHEGTDIMAKVNKRGKYYVVSMTDGIVSKMGWLEKGGYRIGITTEEGIYFYYAHLESYANLKEQASSDHSTKDDIIQYLKENVNPEEFDADIISDDPGMEILYFRRMEKLKAMVYAYSEGIDVSFAEYILEEVYPDIFE
jgi:hypothetical protein